MTHRTGEDGPNFLIIMSDEHSPMFSNTYGHPLVQTPNMDRMARRGVTFDAAYCNAPLCVPSRLSFLTGRYVSRCQGWDNATPLPVDALTWPYLLRSVGYDVALSGKMHLIGPDRLHGFRQQLAFDPHAGGTEDVATASKLGLSLHGRHPIFPWRDGVPTARQPWPSVVEAGPGTSPMIQADDAIEQAALEYLRDPARKEQPFALCVGFVAPHFPFVVPEPYFSVYYPDNADLPNNPPGHLENLPPAARRLRQAFGFDGYTDDQVRRARAGYYGLITYLDDKIGRLLDTLDRQGLADNTVIVYTSDHGESLGEHGLWRKMNFYEQSVRVPLQVCWPGLVPHGVRIEDAVSLVDLTATILEMAGVPQDMPAYRSMDGDSLMPLLHRRRGAWKAEAFAEHLAHGTDRPYAMLRRGKWKLCYGHGDPPEFELYDLEADPGEFANLAYNPAFREVRDSLLSRVLEIWGNPDKLMQEIIASQEARLLIRQVMGDEAPF